MVSTAVAAASEGKRAGSNAGSDDIEDGSNHHTEDPQELGVPVGSVILLTAALLLGSGVLVYSQSLAAQVGIDKLIPVGVGRSRPKRLDF